MRKNAIAAVVLLGAVVACGAEKPTPNAQTDGEVWNVAVDAYLAGDVTNALRMLRPLLLSRTHGARAAEVIAKLSYDQAHKPGTDDPFAQLSEAANAAQIALRALPDDARVNRNFSRAIDGLAELRETARINSVLKSSEGKDPGGLMESATMEARSLLEASGSYLTNAAPLAVALGDRLAARTGKLAETWIPLRQAISQSVTNQEQAATIVAQIEQAEAKTKKAERELSDMDAASYETLSAVEHEFNRFLKLTSLPPAAIALDEKAQTNAWIDAAPVNGRPWQHEALEFTRAFRSKFPAWARAYEQQAQADTNKPPFTAEDQAKVSALATELEKLQLECDESTLPPKQEEALAKIREIRDLLPKDKGGGGQGQGQGQPQQNQQPKNDQNDENQSDQQDRQNADEQQQEEPDQPNEQDRQQSPEVTEADQSEDDKEVDALLKKAQERSDEHEAEKKARMRKAPLPPNERDW